MLKFDSPTVKLILKTQMSLLTIFQPSPPFPSIALKFFFASYRGSLASAKQGDLVLCFPG